jgi:hypothetical protein
MELEIKLVMASRHQSARDWEQKQEQAKPKEAPSMNQRKSQM